MTQYSICFETPVGGAEVVSELSGMADQVPTVELLQSFTDLCVEHRPSGLRQAFCENLLHQPMGETIPTGDVRHFVDESRQDRLVHGVQKVFDYRVFDYALDLVEPKLVAHHRSGGEPADNSLGR